MSNPYMNIESVKYCKNSGFIDVVIKSFRIRNKDILVKFLDKEFTFPVIGGSCPSNLNFFIGIPGIDFEFSGGDNAKFDLDLSGLNSGDILNIEYDGIGYPLKYDGLEFSNFEGIIQNWNPIIGEKLEFIGDILRITSPNGPLYSGLDVIVKVNNKEILVGEFKSENTFIDLKFFIGQYNMVTKRVFF